MDIIEFDWNAFLVPIPQQDSESNEKYLERIVQVLDEFYMRNTFLENKELYKPSKEFSDLSDLTHELNFSGRIGMKLENGRYSGCDVKYSVVIGNSTIDETEGIFVWSHKDMVDYRKPQVDFLKERFGELDYNP